MRIFFLNPPLSERPSELCCLVTTSVPERATQTQRTYSGLSTPHAPPLLPPQVDTKHTGKCAWKEIGLVSLAA